ncbi:MAG: serine/threonine-protein kinase [Eubacteriales bacterium]|nr:serine/threonine-protein kinase [Eubacteriales bacterium]
MERELPISPWQEWEIVEKIGEGAYGRVYKARRTEHGHSFYSAVKVISIPASREEVDSVLKETDSEQSARQYFEGLMEDCLREISTMESFRGNSYIVSVEDFKVEEYLDEIGWDIYIRMEYLTSFTDACIGKEFGPEEVLALGADLARALCYCKKMNIIHRDIKPENIFVSKFGDYKLGDFGIARDNVLDQRTFSRKGTYSYMAPELYKGEDYDDRADIYSLGLVLYKLLNHNRFPLVDLNKQLITYHDKENALVRRMGGEELPRPVDAPVEFGKIIQKACAYRPEDRYRDAQELLEALENLQNKREDVSDSSTDEKELSAKNPGESRNHDAEESWDFGTVTVSDQGEEPERTQKREQRSTGLRKRSQRRKQREDFVEVRVEDLEKQKNPGVSDTVRIVAPWIIAIIVVATAAVVIIGAYMKKMLQDTIAMQTQHMVTQVKDQSVVNGGQDSGTFAEDIAAISSHVTTIVDETDKYMVQGTEGQSLRYTDSDGNLRKVLVYPQISQEGFYEEYYYWNNNLIFAYIWKDDLVDMYYYQDGILIRWIDQNEKTHDNEQANEEYVRNGDRYWNRSVEYLAKQ